MDFLKLFKLLVLALSVASCSSYHSGIYVYQSQVYSSNELSDFNVKHYKNYGNTNFSIILEASEKNLAEQKLEIEEKCKAKEIACRFIILEENIKNSKASIVEDFEQYNKKKFYLYSPTSAGLAKYLGVINLALHDGHEKTLENILEGLKIEDIKELKDTLLGMK